MIPFKYNLRSLMARRTSTLATIVGTAAVVWSSCILFGMADGLRHSLKIAGDPLDLIVLREGATAETTSGFERSKAEAIRTLGGIARDGEGLLSASELVFIPTAERADGGRTNVIVRGVEGPSRRLRTDFQVVQGRDLTPGRGECLVSRKLAGRLKGCELGGSFLVGEKDAFRVVGLFTAGGGVAESEIWTDLRDLARAVDREGIVSCVQLRATSRSSRDLLAMTLEDDRRFRLAATPEDEYYASHAKSSDFLKGGGTLVAVVLTIGAMFASANTMYASVASRTREIGTMRAIGFSRLGLLGSFLGESMLVSGLGGCLGVAAAVPLSLLTFTTRNADTFSDVAVGFRIGPTVATAAVLMTLAMGVFGGLLPAIRAVRVDVVRALREL